MADPACGAKTNTCQHHENHSAYALMPCFNGSCQESVKLRVLRDNSRRCAIGDDVQSTLLLSISLVVLVIF